MLRRELRVSGGIMQIEKRLLNIKELAHYISMPVPTIYTYVSMGKIPPDCIVRIGRALRFEKAAMDEWVSSGAPQSAQAGR
jgi:excisionase family DNA binding protein